MSLCDAGSGAAKRLEWGHRSSNLPTGGGESGGGDAPSADLERSTIAPAERRCPWLPVSGNNELQNRLNGLLLLFVGADLLPPLCVGYKWSVSVLSNLKIPRTLKALITLSCQVFGACLFGGCGLGGVFRPVLCISPVSKSNIENFLVTC